VQPVVAAAQKQSIDALIESRIRAGQRIKAWRMQKIQATKPAAAHPYRPMAIQIAQPVIQRGCEPPAPQLLRPALPKLWLCV
jgi:hypothetical protein